MANSDPLIIHHTTIERGQKRHIEIPMGGLPTQSTISMPLTVIHGAKEGPSLWLNAALHGDELNGTEIIMRVLEKIHPRQLCGTIIAAPIVNVFGFLAQSRYLPDRKDLNRCFPGSKSGSLGAMIAHVFMENVVAHCQYGIDFHTGSRHRSNFPHLRGNFSDSKTKQMGQAFGARFLLNTPEIKGSLREAALKRGKTILTFEGGEEKRYNQNAINCGVKGLRLLLKHLHMHDFSEPKPRHEALILGSSTWVRARRSGLLRLKTDLGKKVRMGQLLGHITDAFGESSLAIESHLNGYVLGMALNPLVHRGDGILHIGVEQKENL